MNRIFTPLGLFLVLSIYAQSVIGASTRSDKGLIGLVDNSGYQYLDGCGCSIRPQARGRNLQHHYYLLTELGSDIGKTAWMNIDGQILGLGLLSTTRPSGRERKGTGFTEIYRGNGVIARITYIVSRPNRPGGEAKEYGITINVTKGNRSQTIKAVGDCGC